MGEPVSRVLESERATLQLVCAVGTRYCALPAEHVLETMRPLPIEPFRGAPGYVLGTSVIRGENVPVVSVASLLGSDDGGEAPSRFVTLRVGARTAALAVGAVLGVRSIELERLLPMPPLLGPAAAQVVEALASMDSALLVVLKTARLVSAEIWDEMDRGARP